MFVATMATIIFLLSLPTLCASAPAAATNEYEIPLSELRRNIKKQPPKALTQRVAKAKKNLSPKVSKRKVQPVVPVPESSATVDSVRMIKEGVRIDVSGLNEKFKLLLEPRNKKMILQFRGLRYLSGNMTVPLGSNGFVQARIGRHRDGTWVVLDTADSLLPAFEIVQDHHGITLKSSSQIGEQAGVEIEADKDDSDKTVLLTRKELLSGYRSYVLTPNIYTSTHEDVETDQLERKYFYTTPHSGEVAAPVVDTESVRIIHIPFSFIVAEKRTIIQAVVSSKNDVKEVYCIVKTTEEGKPDIVRMTKTAGSQYTYEGILPEQSLNSGYLRYNIVAYDFLSNETRSEDFLTPVTTFSFVPGWQQ